VSTQGHTEQGEWSAHVEWTEANDVVLRLHSVSTTTTGLPVIARYYQLRAHRAGVAWFKNEVTREAAHTER
jgi:hypothetical protein